MAFWFTQVAEPCGAAWKSPRCSLEGNSARYRLALIFFIQARVCTSRPLAMYFTESMHVGADSKCDMFVIPARKRLRFGGFVRQPITFGEELLRHPGVAGRQPSPRLLAEPSMARPFLLGLLITDMHRQQGQLIWRPMMAGGWLVVLLGSTSPA